MMTATRMDANWRRDAAQQDEVMDRPEPSTVADRLASQGNKQQKVTKDTTQAQAGSRTED
jgi:hypothetical protein